MTSSHTENPHGVITWGTAGGWGWSCLCGATTRSGGFAPTQNAAYAYGERHIRHALRKARQESEQ